MNPNSNFMEHRWGTRVELDVAAELLTPDGVPADAAVKNASLSGAFVETSAKLPLLSRVSLNIRAPMDEWLDACVVRVEDEGLALEWLDPGSRLVPALLAMRRISRGDVLQTSQERVFNALRSTST
jgi:hypothetical protein